MNPDTSYTCTDIYRMLLECNQRILYCISKGVEYNRSDILYLPANLAAALISYDSRHKRIFTRKDIDMVISAAPIYGKYLTSHPNYSRIAIANLV